VITTDPTTTEDVTTATDDLLTQVMLADPCQPDDVFQVKSSKMFIAAFVVSVLTCHLT